MAHSLFPPSSAATWLECSYSARNAVPEPPKKESTRAAADEGTRRHDLLSDAIVFFGELPDVDDEAREQIALAMDFVRQLEPGILSTEKRVTITDECWGTLDLSNRHPYVSTMFDAKFGKWDVDAYHNKQMLTYAVGEALEIAQRGEQQPEWWRLVIFQPNGLDETPFKQWVAHRSEVEAHYAKILAAVADRSPPKPGPQCRWCNAFHSCPAMTTDAGFVMGAITRRVEDLTTEELVRLLRLIRALGDVKAVYEDALTTHLKMGRTAEGAQLKVGRSWRAWNDDIQAAQVLHQHFGYKGVKPVTPKQAESLGLAGKQYAAVGAHKPPGELKASY